MTSKSRLALGAGLSALVSATPAVAQVRRFDLPAQPLGAAIARFGHQAKRQIVAPDAATRTRRSNPVQGQMDTRAALDRLIAGSGLVVAADRDGVIVLREGKDETSAAAAAEDPAGEDIVVNGSRPIAESQAAALAKQRASTALVSVVASDAVGRLPDQNMAQAVGRIPGVAVQRDQGRARYLNLRGAPISWTTVSFDGINVVSPGGRQTLFDTIPAAIASQIVVRKAVTPDMPGETIAGNVDIVTRSGFDFPGFRLTGKLGGGIQTLGAAGEADAALAVSDRFATGIGEIAVVLSGTYFHRDFYVDNFENFWAQVPRDQRPGGADRIWASSTVNKFYRFTNRNYAGSGRLEWKIDDRNTLFVSSVYTALTETEARNRNVFILSDQKAVVPGGTAPCGAPAAPAAFTTGYADVCTGNTPQRGTVYSVPVTVGFSYKDFLQSIGTTTIGGDHRFDRWSVHWRGNYTRALNDRGIPNTMVYGLPAYGTNGANAASRPTVDYDNSDPLLSRVALYRTLRSSSGVLSKGAAIASIEELPLTLATLTGLRAKDVTDAYTGKLAVSRDLTLFGHDSVLTIGGQYDRRVKTARESTITLSTAAQFATAGIPTAYAAALESGTPRGGLPVGYAAHYFSIGTLLGNLPKAEGVAGYLPTTANYYRVSEDVAAGYAMLKTDFAWGNVVTGVRVENVRNRGRAFVALNGAFAPIVDGSSGTLAFPSLHANLNLDATKLLRLSLTTGAARPDSTILRPNFTYNDTGLTVSGGNPRARPERAKGVDLYFEWYTRPQGFVSLGAFYKRLDDVLFSASGIFNSDVLNSGGIDRSAYTYTTTLNGGSGKLYGIEGNFQQQLAPYAPTLGLPAWLGGFGVQANFTLNRGTATTPTGRRVQFPGASRFVYNIGAYYEVKGFSARLNYQYRTPWIDAIANAADGGDLHFARDEQLDFSSRFAVTRHVELYFDVANILNTPLRRYAGVTERTIEFARYGQRFEGGVRINF